MTEPQGGNTSNVTVPETAPAIARYGTDKDQSQTREHAQKTARISLVEGEHGPQLLVPLVDWMPAA